MNARQAVKRRDFAALQQSITDQAQAEEFRTYVLPFMQPADCRWFWQQVMTPDQLEETFEAMREAVLHVAQVRQLVPQKVQGGYEDDFPVIYATPEARTQVFSEFEEARHSFLNALVVPFPG